MNIQEIEPSLVKQWIESGQALVVDVRGADERIAERIAGTIHVPVAQVAEANLAIKPGQKLVFHCRGGGRSAEACAAWAGRSAETAYSLKGGIEAWKKAKFPVESAKVPISIMRQAQIGAGTLVLIGTVLGSAISAKFLWLSGFVGVGLVFAGVSGFCGMAALLSVMPWNKVFRTAKSS